ncbi:heavy-metal-associated domain-containing protein [Lutibacter sp.]
MKKIIPILILTFLFISCSENKKETVAKKSEDQKTEVAANYKSIEVDIEGMTCEIGCARTIQSKLSKVDGVTYSKVNFEAKKGIFTYDSNKLSEQDITNKISGIGGGDLYSVTKTTEIEEVIKKIE